MGENGMGEPDYEGFEAEYERRREGSRDEVGRGWRGGVGFLYLRWLWA